MSPGCSSAASEVGADPAFLLSPFWPLQEKNLTKAYTEAAAVHQQQMHQLELARKLLEKVWRWCPLRPRSRQPGLDIDLAVFPSSSPCSLQHQGRLGGLGAGVQFPASPTALPNSSYRLVSVSVLGPEMSFREVTA